MNACTETTLEAEIIRILNNSNDHDLSEIVRELRVFADDASIKAALLRLNSEGVLEITPDWKFRSVAAGR